MCDYGLDINFQAKTREPSISLDIFVFTVKGTGFGTLEHAIKSLFICFKNQSDFKFNCFKSPEITSMSRIAPFDLTCEISDVSSKNFVTTLVFVRRIEGKME